jgi:hypothetical protein
MSFLQFQQTYLEVVIIHNHNIIARLYLIVVIQQHLLKYLRELIQNAHIHMEWIQFGQSQIIDLPLSTVLK